MTCDLAHRLAGAYLDGELDPLANAQMDEHLATCHDCAESYAEQTQLRARMRQDAPYYRAPDALRTRIGKSLPKPEPPRYRRWMAIAAAILLAAFAAFQVMHLHPGAVEPDAREVLSSHVRSLMGAHLLDVPSTDRHTVKPWFNGRLDYSPDVKDFAAQGFPLAGGRLDYIENRPVAALVYRRGQHVINLFTWPSNEQEGEAAYHANGYNIVRWRRAGMVWWAVSDVSNGDLRQFVDLYRK